jgi:large subunit ribosomal protein MRP49
MAVSRTTDQSGPATMTVFYASPSTSTTVTSTATAFTASTPPGNVPQERAVSINMKHISESEIFSQLSRLTGLEPIKATPEEEAMMRGMEEDTRVRQADAKRSAKQREQRKREADMLRQAKGKLVG